MHTIVTARQRGQMSPGGVDGAQGTLENLRSAGAANQSQRGESGSIHDLEPEDGG